MDAYAEEYSNASCHEESCERRRVHLVKALKERFTEDVDLISELPHVFLENKGAMSSGRNQKKAEFQRAELAKAFNSLVGAFCANQLIPIHRMEYRKSEENVSLDDLMRQMFTLRMTGMRDSLVSVESAQSSQLKQVLDSSDKCMQTVVDISSISAEIARLDTTQLQVVEQDTASVSWYFWGGRRDVRVLAFPCPKEAVAVDYVKNEGYPTGKLEEISFDYNQKKGRTEWKVKCSAAWCRSYEFKLKMMVQRRYREAERIAKLRADLARRQQELPELEEDFQKLRGIHSSLAQTFELYQKQSEFYGECAAGIGGLFLDLDVWRRISPFYRWAASKEGQDAFRRPGGTHEIIEKYCEVHSTLDKYREISGTVS